MAKKCGLCGHWRTDDEMSKREKRKGVCLWCIRAERAAEKVLNKQGLKTCSRCKRQKRFSLFGICRASKTGRQGMCMMCYMHIYDITHKKEGVAGAEEDY